VELQVEETVQVTAAEKVEQQQKKKSGAAGGAAVEKNAVALQVEQR
jgi:hypothetical protein